LPGPVNNLTHIWAHRVDREKSPFGVESGSRSSQTQLWCGLDEHPVFVNEGGIGLERRHCEMTLALQCFHDHGKLHSAPTTKTETRVFKERTSTLELSCIVAY
jgi:hypothetical protein